MFLKVSRFQILIILSKELEASWDTLYAVAVIFLLCSRVLVWIIIWWPSTLYGWLRGVRGEAMSMDKKVHFRSNVNV